MKLYNYTRVIYTYDANVVLADPFFSTFLFAVNVLLVCLCFLQGQWILFDTLPP